ncbi:uncharacterized protein LOC103698860 [Phoenix dactylifera]|uniref:Uncharacterized protein LOC103698860 n=1 Tax=Phoenix dactylifera TaxID=42345 RepID=A0A8B7BK64_PHODC|nr:uncharacterized protein LOC103698860 [Phoenix dactylifera]
MEALFSQFSFLANQALHDKNFDPARIEELLDLFEQEAYASWSSVEAEHQKAAQDAMNSLKEAEDYLDSIMEAAMAEFRQSYDAAEKSSKEELSSLVHAADAARKMGQSLGAATAGSSEKYLEAGLSSATVTMKSACATSKVHPS